MLGRYHQLRSQLNGMTSAELNEDAVPDVCYNSLNTLMPRQMINDEVMNKFLQQLLQTNMQLSVAGLAPAVHIFNTHFMEQLYLGFQKNPEERRIFNYAAVKRWTNPSALTAAGQLKASILDCRLLVVPCHLMSPEHWVLAVADLQLRRIMYIDPLLVSFDITCVYCQSCRTRRVVCLYLNLCMSTHALLQPECIGDRTCTIACRIHVYTYA